MKFISVVGTVEFVSEIISAERGGTIHETRIRAASTRTADYVARHGKRIERVQIDRPTPLFSKASRYRYVSSTAGEGAGTIPANG